MHFPFLEQKCTCKYENNTYVKTNMIVSIIEWCDFFINFGNFVLYSINFLYILLLKVFYAVIDNVLSTNNSKTWTTVSKKVGVYLIIILSEDV